MTSEAKDEKYVRGLRSWKPVWLALSALSLSLILNCLRYLYGCDKSVNAIWPAQVIFGFYLVILVLCVQGLQAKPKLENPPETPTPLRRLFLLALICLCSDLVSVNYAEAQNNEPGFYGLVVLWDFVVFFAWLRTIDLVKDANNKDFLSSPLISIAPVLKLGRELVFVPYSHWENLHQCAASVCDQPAQPQCPASLQSAYADLLFGDLAVCCWFFVVLGYLSKPGSRLEQWGHLAPRFVFFGCVYWSVKAFQNAVAFAVPHLFDCDRLGRWELWLSFLYAAFAFVVTLRMNRGRRLARVSTFFGVVKL